MDAMTLNDYRKLVERVMHDVQASDNCPSRVFTNSGTEHASIVLNVMVDNAQSSLDVFSHEMSAEVWDAKSIRRFLGRSSNARIRAIVTNKDCVTSAASCLSELQDFISDKRVEVKTINLPDSLRPSHLTISDGCHFRLETDAVERKAVVTFGKSETSAVVAGLFDKLWSVAH